MSDRFAADLVLVLHASFIAFVVLGLALRRRAGGTAYDESFVAHWLGELIYYQAPWWVFVVAYTAFGAAAALSWFWVRPR